MKIKNPVLSAVRKLEQKIKKAETEQLNKADDHLDRADLSKAKASNWAGFAKVDSEFSAGKVKDSVVNTAKGVGGVLAGSGLFALNKLGQGFSAIGRKLENVAGITRRTVEEGKTPEWKKHLSGGRENLTQAVHAFKESVAVAAVAGNDVGKVAKHALTGAKDFAAAIGHQTGALATLPAREAVGLAEEAVKLGVEADAALKSGAQKLDAAARRQAEKLQQGVRGLLEQMGNKMLDAAKARTDGAPFK